MPIQVIILLVISGLLHASWNLLLKQSRDKVIFNWWSIFLSFLITSPLLWLLDFRLTATTLGLVVASALFEALYVISLARSYDRGDFSLVYPLARGSAPLFIALGAFATLSERPTKLGWAGILLIIAGIYSSNLRGGSDARWVLRSIKEPAVRSALITGLLIAGYSVIDKVGVAYLPVPVYLSLVFGGISLLLVPYLAVQRGWREVAAEWNHGRRSILAVTILAFLAYALVLVAMQRAPVSYVGSAREISVIFGAILGTIVLKERMGLLRISSAGIIFAGVVCLSLAG